HYVDHRFRWESSGMFGEEAPGEWVTESEALRIYRKIFIWHKLFVDENSSIHRVLKGLRLLLEKIFKKETRPGPAVAYAAGNEVPAMAKRHPIEMLACFARRMVPVSAWYDTHATTE
ncbi:MAG: hypothetical protein WBM14_19155, partial [Terracidiphilus sp.]